jgi:hypothetical protein
MQSDGLLNTLAGIGSSIVTLVPSYCASVRCAFCFAEVVAVPKGLNSTRRSSSGSVPPAGIYDRTFIKRQKGGVSKITS